MTNPLYGFIDQHPWLMALIVTAALLTFLLSLVVVPWLVVRIPADYFAGEERPPSPVARGPGPRLLIGLAKNLSGALFIIMGLAMLVLPGQGLLTIFIGFLLLDFPGKYCMERWLVRRKPVLAPVNWLRQRFGRPPLRFQLVRLPRSD